MNSVITALGNPYLNSILKKDNQINVLLGDIQYQDGIFECFEKNINIDYIILSELLPGQFNIKELINHIKQKNSKVKIILVLEKENEELENYLYSKGIFKVFYNNKVEINEIVSLIKDEIDLTDNEKIIKEIECLKKILIKNNIQIDDNSNNLLNNNISEENNKKDLIYTIKKINMFNRKILNKNKINKSKLNSKKIISILGTGGSRKKYFNY